jgi:hypothetical protein
MLAMLNSSRGCHSVQPILIHVHGLLISKAQVDDTSTVSGPSKLLLSAILLVWVLFSVAKVAVSGASIAAAIGVVHARLDVLADDVYAVAASSSIWALTDCCCWGQRGLLLLQRRRLLAESRASRRHF